MALRSEALARAWRAVVLLTLACAGACGGGGGGDAPAAFVTGQEVAKPDGSGSYFADPHAAGRRGRFRLAEVVWGRLVDVHDVGPDGRPGTAPVFRDFVINENVQTDATAYRLETNPITQQTRLVIRRQRGAPATGGATFDELLRAAAANLPAVIAKGEGAAGPFSLVPRNACLVLRFDDLLGDDAEARRALGASVRVLTGYPPSVPLRPRVFFDRNHGGTARGAFHTTRVLVDLAVTEAEAADSGLGIPVNALGLPASLRANPAPNVSLRIPTATDVGSGQFAVLRNLGGAPLAVTRNGPVADGPSADLLRALRSANSADLNNGFLLDLNPPEIVGSWPASVDAGRATRRGPRGIRLPDRLDPELDVPGESADRRHRLGCGAGARGDRRRPRSQLGRSLP